MAISFFQIQPPRAVGRRLVFRSAGRAPPCLAGRLGGKAATTTATPAAESSPSELQGEVQNTSLARQALTPSAGGTAARQSCAWPASGGSGWGDAGAATSSSFTRRPREKVICSRSDTNEVGNRGSGRDMGAASDASSSSSSTGRSSRSERRSDGSGGRSGSGRLGSAERPEQLYKAEHRTGRGGGGSGGGAGEVGRGGPVGTGATVGAAGGSPAASRGNDVNDGVRIGRRGEGGSAGDGRARHGSRGRGKRDHGISGDMGASAASDRILPGVIRMSSSSSGSKSTAEAKRINQAIIEAGRGRRHEDILRVVESHGSQFNHVNVATALHRLGSCGLQPGGRLAMQLLSDPRFGQLLRMAGEHLPSFADREVANCLWALAKLGCTQHSQQQHMLQQQQHIGPAAAVVASQQQPASLSEEAAAAAATVAAGSSSGSGHSSGGGWSLVEGLCTRVVVTLGEFGPQEVANSLWAAGSLGHYPGETVLRGLSQRLLEVLPETAPQGVSNSLLGLAKLGWSPGGDWLDEMAHGSVAKVGAFDPQALSNTLWALARLGHRNDTLQAAIFQQAFVRASGFEPQGISNLVWAAATLGLGLAAEAAGGVTEGVNHLGDISEALLQTFCDQAVLKLQGFTPQNMSNLLWASAKLGYTHEPLLRAVAGMAARQLATGVNTGWNSQEVTNATWAYATLGFHPGEDYLRQACHHVSRCASSYKWQELANMVWALAALKHHDNTALAAVEAEVVARMTEAADSEVHTQSLSPVDVTAVLLSYATLQRPAPDLFNALLPLLVECADQFMDAELVDSLWAMATLGVYDEHVLDTIGSHICQHHLNQLPSHQLARVAWAYGELRHAHQALFDGIAARAVAFMSSADSAVNYILELPYLSRICCVAGIFGWRYPALLDVATRSLHLLHRAVFQQGPDGGAATAAVPTKLLTTTKRLDQVVLNLAWGLSLVGGCSPKLWNQAVQLVHWAAVDQDVGVWVLRDEALRQLYQTYMHVQWDYPTAALALGPPGLLDHAAEAWRQRTTWGAEVSSFQLEVSNKLRRLGLRHEAERLVDGGDFSIDLAMELKVPLGVAARQLPTDPQQRKGAASGTTSLAESNGGSSSEGGGSSNTHLVHIAVEADGPTHFTSNTHQPLGTTIYRRRCLEARGWVVVSVPYWRWYEIPPINPRRREALLKELLQEAGLGEVLKAVTGVKRLHALKKPNSRNSG